MEPQWVREDVTVRTDVRHPEAYVAGYGVARSLTYHV